MRWAGSRIALAHVIVLSTAVAMAAVDVSGIDTFLMQDMEQAVKELEPLIGARDTAGATETATFLSEGLQWTEDYFAAQQADDAAALAREGRERAAAVLAALAAADFSAAADAARGVSRACRSCHDAYRP